KLFRFYSGIQKGGTVHRMLSCTVTIFERWSDVIKHEIEVCRPCQVRLWRKKHFMPMALCAAGAGVAVLTALVLLIALRGADYFVLPALALFGAVALGVLFAVTLSRYQDPKPKASLVEPLVIEEAMDHLPGEDHTFMTSEQYLERYRAGILG
ncbi:MAG: hypothetical protein ACRC33_11310, partial [Gemmataceae bacterium]